MRILGHDPGVNGCYCLIDSETLEIDYLVTPSNGGFIDCFAIYNWLMERKDSIDVVYTEKLAAIFGCGASTTFGFGFNVGQSVALFEALQMKVVAVPPRTWQKQMWLPHFIAIKSAEMGPKEKSLSTAKHYLPNFPMPQVGVKKKYDHDGFVDSLLITLFGFEQNKISLKEAFKDLKVL